MIIRFENVAYAACLALLSCSSLRAQESAPPVTEERLAEIFAGGDPQNTAELEAMQDHVQALLRRVLPATVSLPGASGVLVRRGESFYVLCAAHVTERADKRLFIRLTSGETLRGTSLGADHKSDVSLIRVDTEGLHPGVEIGNSAALQRGQWVLMLGHPSGRKNGRTAPARLGRVLRVPERGYLVTDCTMQSGDSGGPLFDMQGRVVGINSRITRNLAMNMHAPVNALIEQWGELQEGLVTEAPRRGRRGRRGSRTGFGVRLEYGEGCPVFGEVPADSEAEKAGLRKGDRLFEIDEVEVLDWRSVWRALRGLEPGSKVTIVIERDGQGHELTLPLVRGGGR